MFMRGLLDAGGKPYIPISKFTEQTREFDKQCEALLQLTPKVFYCYQWTTEQDCEVRMKENAVEKQVVDSTLAVRKETEQMRSTREPPGMYRHWQLVLVAVVLLMLIWCKSRM